MAIVTLSRWGNSSAVRIPNQFLKRLNIKEGTEFEAHLTSDNDIVLRPIKNVEETMDDLRAHRKMLLSKITSDTPRHEEIDLGIEGDELI